MDDMNDLSPEDLIRLSALREVLGGFAHEIAQPLNAIMIASQVVQLAVERSALSQEEKAFLTQRLGIISLQVRRTGTIVETMRKFVRGDAPGPEVSKTDVAGVVESVCSLMNQQLSSRGIALTLDLDQSGLQTSVALGLVECLVIQELAFARNAAESIGRIFEAAGISYKKALQLKLFRDGDDSVIDVRWHIGERSAQTESLHSAGSSGLTAAASVLSTHGGKLEASADSIVMRFPS